MDKDMEPKIDLNDRGLLMSLSSDELIDGVEAYYLREIYGTWKMYHVDFGEEDWKDSPVVEAGIKHRWMRRLLTEYPAVETTMSARNPIGFCAWSRYAHDGISVKAYMAVDYTDREELESCPSEQLVDAYEAAFYDLDVDISVLRDVIATRFPQEWAQYSQWEEWGQVEDRVRCGLRRTLAPKLRRLRTDGEYRCDRRDLIWFTPLRFKPNGKIGPWGDTWGDYLCEEDRITMEITWYGPYNEAKTGLTGRILTGGDILLDDGQRYRFYPDFE